MSSDKVAAFAGTLAEFYDRYLVPLNFAPYAEVVAERAKRLLPRRVLETAAGGPPPLGLHVLMGTSTPEKVQNMINNISNGRIAPVELIARKL